MYSTISLVLLTAAPAVQAWGSLGHDTIAYIAQIYVNSDTEQWAQAILNDTTDSYLANCATWADTYRYTAEGSFSAPFHFIDAEDNPPKSCNVNYTRDCGAAGCSVSAIANYTQRVMEPSKLDDTQVNYALRWIIHFLGDITQPLHDEALELGGNDIDVTFDGTSTNLHHIWDTNMPEKLRGGYSLTDAQAWAQNLSAEIDSGVYKKQANSWLDGIKLDDPIDTAMLWATDANAYVCSTVLPNGQSAVETGDLDGDYYKSAIPVVELQIAKAGYRLATWLDLIAATQTNDTKRFSRRVLKAQPDLTGMDLLPESVPLSKSKLVRAAVGFGCKH